MTATQRAHQYLKPWRVKGVALAQQWVCDLCNGYGAHDDECLVGLVLAEAAADGAAERAPAGRTGAGDCWWAMTAFLGWVAAAGSVLVLLLVLGRFR